MNLSINKLYNNEQNTFFALVPSCWWISHTKQENFGGITLLLLSLLTQFVMISMFSYR